MMSIIKTRKSSCRRQRCLRERWALKSTNRAASTSLFVLLT